MITKSEENAKVGQSLQLILDPEFPGDASAVSWTIRYRIGRQAIASKAAVVVETGLVQAEFLPAEINQAGNMRSWVYGIGEGTLVFIGHTYLISIDPEDG